MSLSALHGVTGTTGVGMMGECQFEKCFDPHSADINQRLNLLGRHPASLKYDLWTVARSSLCPLPLFFFSSTTFES